MKLHSLCAIVVIAGIAVSGCKNDRQCWVDYTAEVSFCNSGYLDCWSTADTPYSGAACYHETHATCMDDARTVLTECADDDDCLAGRLACESACDDWDTSCVRVCDKAMLECTGGESCEWGEAEAEAIAAADDDDSAGDDDDDDSAGDDDTADPFAEDGVWVCDAETWYNPSCEAACNEIGGACVEVAGCTDMYNPFTGEECAEPLDLHDQETFNHYVEVLNSCEVTRRACTMCCYGVEYHDELTCDVFGL